MRVAITLVLLSSTLGLYGCASIVSKSEWPVTISSTPPGASVTLKSQSGGVVAQGETPMTTTLPSSRGYFKPASYDLEYEMEGYFSGSNCLKATVNPWYFGNVLFVYGFFIDPASGAMWKIRDHVDISLMFDPSADAKCLARADATGTLEAYDRFLVLYPQSRLRDQAVERRKVLEGQIQLMEQAVRNALPAGAKVTITPLSRYPQEPEYVIAAHLLVGHSADDSSPYVRGVYGTHESLERLIRMRCVRILKSIAENSPPARKAQIVIEVRHGVRQSYGPVGFGGTDVAMTIYEIAVPTSAFKDSNLKLLDDEQVMKQWQLRRNIIPSLKFQTEWDVFR